MRQISIEVIHLEDDEVPYEEGCGCNAETKGKSGSHFESQVIQTVEQPTVSVESEEGEKWSRYNVVNLRNKKHWMVESEVREVRRTKPLSHNGTKNFPSLATFLYSTPSKRLVTLFLPNTLVASSSSQAR